MSNQFVLHATRVARSSLLVVASACASAGMGSSSAPAGSQTNGPMAQPGNGWRVTTLEHVDLWLHGFALLTSDTGRVPFFARGYKQQMTALKRQRNTYTLLDANQQDLSARFAANPSLASGQFAAMYFPSFQAIVNATDLFVRANGDPRAASDLQSQQEIALLASSFPSPADRNWLRLFVQSLQDENTRFYNAYWGTEQQNRGAALGAFREAWMSRYYPRLSRFLNNTQQSAGRLVLSLPLGGEGRTISDGKQANMIAVDFPATVDESPDAVFTFVHEAVSRLVEEAIRDNTTPAEQRSGSSAGFSGNGAVRAGAVLLQRTSPEILAAYMRFYLRTRGSAIPAGDPSAAFAAAFPIPAAILAAVTRQIDVVLGGI